MAYKNFNHSVESRKLMSEKLRLRWQDPVYRANGVKRLRGLWDRPGFRERQHFARLGNKNCEWKGGRTHDAQGYIRVYLGPRKYRLEHRFVMEQYLGRRLDKSEVVHHINGDKTDNRIKNLILTTQSDHNRHHKPWERARKCPNCGYVLKKDASTKSVNHHLHTRSP